MLRIESRAGGRDAVQREGHAGGGKEAEASPRPPQREEKGAPLFMLDHDEEVMNDPEAQNAFQEAVEDEMNFIDLERSPIWLGEEHVIIEDGKPVTY